MLITTNKVVLCLKATLTIWYFYVLFCFYFLIFFKKLFVLAGFYFLLEMVDICRYAWHSLV